MMIVDNLGGFSGPTCTTAHVSFM